MVYKFRVILDAEQDVIRDIAILSNETLEDLHNAIFNSFGFDGTDIGSFYTCDNTWDQEDEISLFDSGDVLGEQKIMADYKLSDILDKKNTKIIYVYDFINMWTFLVELASIENINAGATYPETLYSTGEMPAEALEKHFIADEDQAKFNEFEDGFDQEDLDNFEDDNLEDFGFEERWN